jgi:N-acetylglucosamine kinase-like BadF-type ATPase
VLWKRRAPPLRQLPITLRALWKQNNWGQIDRLIVGSKGVWSAKERKKLRAQMAPLAREVTPLSDVELALYSAFPDKNRGHRAILLAGTGSIAVGISSTGRMVRAGGRGPDRGDEGSGYWIGKELVRRSAAQKQGGIKRPRDIANVRAIAALAKQTVVRSAHDPLCAKIVQEAQSHLAALVNDIVRQLKPHASLALTWGGSLLSNPRFRKGVFLKIKSIHKKSIRFVAPPKNPVETAVLHPTCIPAKPPPLPPRK